VYNRGVKSDQPKDVINVCVNRKARHDYEIIETFEAGIVLTGPEVKSLREGRANLKDSYIAFETGEAFLVGAHISPYPHAWHVLQEPERNRKLLLHSREISRLSGKVTAKGLTVIPLKIYFKKGRAKVEIALARGRREYEKKDAIKERIMEREARQAIKG